MIIREATQVASIDLGSATVANYDAKRRRVMQVVCLPLTAADATTAADAITVLDPGTGRNERCQAEEWVIPYPSGASRVLRLTFPAVMPGSDLRRQFEFRRTDVGELPPYSPRQHVLDRLQELQIQFFCGPSSQGYYQIVKQAGAALPAPIYSGTRSKVYRWFSRVYEPAHAPSLHTQFWTEFDIEVFHDEDYAAFWWRWGVDDPRIDEPDGVRRELWSDWDTSVGYDFIPAGANQNGVRPVVFFPGGYSAPEPVHWLTDYAWRFSQDRRALATNGTIANNTLPWGTMGQGKGVLLFPGLTGSHGDQLRDDSLQAWIDTPFPVLGVGDDWVEKQEAHGPLGLLPKPLKLCEWRQRRTFDQWRTLIENESFAQANIGSRIPYAWDAYAGDGQYLHQAVRYDATGAAGSWNKAPCYIACTYRVPGYGLFAERHLGVYPWMTHFREVDGDIVRGENHPDMIIDKGSPGRVSGNGDMLGKTALQSWRTNEYANCIITVQGAGAFGGLPHIGSDTAHWENGWFSMVPAIFGDRGLHRMAESLCYGMNWGSWQRDSHVGQGSTGQPRGWARGMTQWAWFLYLFGRDEGLIDQCASAVHDWFYEPARQGTTGRYPGRVFTSINDFSVWWQTSTPRPSPDVTRVILRDQPYTRPWEDGIGALGAYGLWRMIGPQYPTEAQAFLEYARGISHDTWAMHTPRVVEPDGRISFNYLRPHSAAGSPPYAATIYEPAAAAAIVAGGTRRMNQSEMLQNNWEICSGGAGNLAFQCDTCNDGFMRLGAPSAGTKSFTLGAMALLSDMDGALGDILATRYLDEGVYSSRGEDGNDASVPRMRLLLDRYRWCGPALHYVVLGLQTTRATNSLSGITGMSTSRQPGADQIVRVVRSTDALVRSVNWHTGSVVATLTPTVTPAQGRWSAITCFGSGGQDLFAVLDGANDAWSRTTYQIAISQDGATSSWTAVSFTIPDGTPRAITGMAWDPNVGTFLVVARTQAGVASLWRVPLGGGTANADSLPVGDRSVIDTSQASTIDVLDGGKLMVLTRIDGQMDLYAHAAGGYWGSSRVLAQMPAGHTRAAFTRHGRWDDALRIVTVGAQFVETEV